MELDDLKRAWEECDRELDISIRLNRRLLRSCILESGDTDRKQPSRGEIDYSAPVIVVQKRRRTTRWMLRLVAARMKRSSLVSDFDGDEIVGKVCATLLRVLRRHRVLGG